MHIREVVIEGFKSYAVRTVVGPFDEQFNAITGKNGTGKSNILDALCFVLGISQLSKVRVHSLAELVYKQGQTGITKACVCVHLDNRNKLRSPVGYENDDEVTVEREIVIGGRNKYRINGKNVSQQQVISLFHSVQLNVNNPHFLIMQGTITRVINMKPPEVAGLLEEAAGTKMYENRKLDALKTLEKKHIKIKEIDQVLNVDLVPAMNKLRQERGAYQAWNEQNTVLLRLDRFCIAVEFFKATELADGLNCQAALVAQMTEIKHKQDAIKVEMETSETRLKFLKDKNAQSAEIGKLKDVLKKLKDESNKVEFDHDSAQRKLTSLTRSIAEGGAAVRNAGSELEQAKSEEAALEHKLDKSKNDLESVEQTINGYATTSLTVDPELQVDLTKSRKERDRQLMIRTKLESEAAKIDRSIKHEHERRIQMEQKAKDQHTKKLDIQKKLEQIDQQIQAISFDEKLYGDLCRRERELNQKRDDLKENTLSLRKDLDYKFRHEYRRDPAIPEKNIHGLVGQLLRVRPDFADSLQALEIVAGAKLFNLVVDNKQTATILFDKHLLGKKMTVLPIRDLNYKTLTDNQKNTAADIARAAGKRVTAAIDLVEFRPEHRPVFEFIFGTVFVCEDYDVASRVCAAVHTRCITLKGDMIEPGGTAMGGLAPKHMQTLQMISDFQNAEAESLRLRSEADEITGRIATMRTERARTDSLKTERRQLENHLKDAQEEASLADMAGHEERQEASMQKRKSISESIEKTDSLLSSLDKSIADLDRKVNSTTGTSGVKDKAEAMRSLNSQKAREEAIKAGLEKQMSDQKNVIIGLEERIVSVQEALDANDAERRTVTASLEKLRVELQGRRNDVDEAKKQLVVKEREELDKNKEMEEIGKLIDRDSLRLEELTKEDAKLRAKVEVIKSQAETAKQTAAKIEKENIWLKNGAILKDLCALTRRARDGVPLDPDTPVEVAFREVSEKEVAKRRAEVETTREEIADLATRINKKAVAMCERAEADLTQLLSKRAALEKEKTTIEDLINDLDEQKGKALINTWQVVNGHFGHIFRALLPNVDARLEPPSGMTAQDGLELRVAFGGKWKESLSELSGGQKSLLALSLILALLKYKPAPFYILDEVDAALDVSHTKNIGHMIKTVFPDSQFIIVSLKEGMFQNANVLFSTRFQDGTSMVSRSTHSSSNTVIITEDREQDKQNRKRTRLENIRE